MSLPSSSLVFKRKRGSNSFDDELKSCKRPKNDVFMNYSYEDIGKSFISHLKGALGLNGFTISDHTMLSVGQDMGSELLKAIKESEIYLLIFSPDYASSTRCLDELVNVMDCFNCRLDERKILPVFFKVEPSDVRNQQGPFMEAFQAHWNNINPQKVQKWKQALTDVCKLAGLTLQIGDDAKFKLDIVEELEKMKRPQDLHVTEHPVGVGSRAEELISTLRLAQKDCVLVVAVFGISGIGKTAIVKEAYNRIAPSFDLSIFLADIYYKCLVPSWKVELPNALISCLTRENKIPFMSNHTESVSKIRRLVSRQKILLVLDDIDKFQQLESLGIYPKWFYEGSRIIVTTRDKRSLGNIPYASYHTRSLNRRESLSLFTRLMFARDDPVNTKFIEEVAVRAGGLPLVIKVWSCHFKQYESEQWPSILETLKRIPHGDVIKQLQLSYDSLNNRSKKLFLDIACFFVGMKKDLVVRVLQDEDSGFFPDIDIQYLVDKFLVEITEYGDLRMHHAIREMGHEVVRQENEDEPGQRTRLWDSRDVMRVLREFSGTESVETIILSGGEDMPEEVTLDALRKMSNLRLIHFSGSIFSHVETTHLYFKKLRYMDWYKFPFKSFENINMGNNIVYLRVGHSKLEALWEGIKNLKKLRILDVSDSNSLVKTCNFSGLENLEELRLNRCSRLQELDYSIGCLKKLAILDLRESSIPSERTPWEMIGKLTSLQELCVGEYGAHYSEVNDRMLNCLKECPLIILKFSECKISVGGVSLAWLKHLCLKNYCKFSGHPDGLLQLHGLTSLKLTTCQGLKTIPNLPENITSIKIEDCQSLINLPCNISELKSVTLLHIEYCPELGTEDPHFLMKITGLINLTHLTVNQCSVSQVPMEIGNMVSLEKLDLSKNTFSSLPDTLSNLSQLGILNLWSCKQLQWLPLLPSNLISLKTSWCDSLDVRSPALIRIGVSKDSPCSNRFVIQLPRMRVIPHWCSYQSRRGGTISFIAPMDLENNICGFILFVDTRISFRSSLIYKVYNKTKSTSHSSDISGCLFRNKFWTNNYDMFLTYYPLNDTTLSVERGDSVELQLLPQRRIKQCGLTLIYESDVVDGILVFPTGTEPMPHICFVDDYSCSDDEDDEDDVDIYDYTSCESSDDEFVTRKIVLPTAAPHIYSDDDYSCSRSVDDNSSSGDEDAWTLCMVHESGVVDGNLVLSTATEPMPEIPSEIPPGIITQMHDTSDKDELLRMVYESDVEDGNFVLPAVTESIPNIILEMPPDLTQIHNTSDEWFRMMYESDMEDGNLAFQTATELVPNISMQTQMQAGITRLSAILNDTQLDVICNDSDNDDYWCLGDLFLF